MSRRTTFALVAALALLATGAGAQMMDPGAPAVPAWAPVDGGPLVPGAPFVVYAGDRAGNPMTLIDAGLLPLPGDPDVILVIPPVPGAGVYLWSPGTVVPIPPPRNTLRGRPVESLGRLIDPNLPGATLPDGSVVAGSNPGGIDQADDTPYVWWTRSQSGDHTTKAVGGRPDPSPFQPRAGIQLQRFPTNQVLPGGLTPLGEGGTLTDGTQVDFGRFGRTPPTPRTPDPGVVVGGRPVESLGRLVHPDLGDIAAPGAWVQLTDGGALGMAGDTPHLGAPTYEASSGRPDPGPFQPRNGVTPQRFPYGMVLPGAATSLGEGGTLTDGNQGHDFGRLGKTPPTPPPPPGDGLPREFPGFVRLPAPPANGPALGAGVSVWVFVGDGNLPSFTNDAR